ncbi:MAG TPA: TetR/AcrR family transcriptional regulator [Tepidisphaeraceae bacterium]|jgi:AcrR family transcriptional regulator|nr:TetR/AcrR family transcriptional regulator [Tepidisphaeraceae bacterium]
MRVSAETKAATRERILSAARRLLSEKGYESTTTRDIAQAAQIASGTLFNYFPTKEAIVAFLASEAVAQALNDANSATGKAETLDEDLFAVVAAGLRKLKPLRKHLPALLETSLSPLAVTGQNETESFRVSQLEAVTALAAKHGYGELSASALQLYWTLYTGVLVFWANDKSPRQEETLALIDDSINMFVGWLRNDAKTDDQRKR